MTVVSNTTAQTLQPGESITFDVVVLQTGSAECFRVGTSSVKMKTNGIYDVIFTGNVAALTAATTVNLMITMGDDRLPETAMTATSTAAGDVNNVAGGTKIKNDCCDYDRLRVTNVGTVPVVVAANSRFDIKRVG